MVTWPGWLAGVLDVFVLPFSWDSSCQEGLLWLDRKACQQGRQGGSGKWGTRSLASLGLPRADLPSAVFLFSLLAPSLDCRLGRAGLGWGAGWRTGEACLLQNPVPIAAVCGAATSWAFGALRSLNWVCSWLSLLFAKSFVTQHLLSSFQVCATIVFSWLAFYRLMSLYLSFHLFDIGS